MKKFFNVLVLTLAINFLAIAGGVWWLRQHGALDRAKVMAIKQILFPPPAEPPATQPAEDATTQPALRLEALLAQYAGRPPEEQLEYIRHSFDSQMMRLEQAQVTLKALQDEVNRAQQKVNRDKAALEEDRKALASRQEASQRLADDKGFQDSLAMYLAMPAKTVKTIFMGLDDSTVIRYLQAMEPREAARIEKEFKTPSEILFLKRIMERMRDPQATIKE